MKTKQMVFFTALALAAIAVTGCASSKPLTEQLTEKTTDIFYDEWAVIILRNDTNEGVVFLNDTSPMRDQDGKRYVDHGKSAIFELAAPNPGRAYTNLNLEFDSRRTIRLGPIDIKPWIMYEVYISNSFSYALRELQRFNDSEELKKHLESYNTQ